MGNMVMRFYKPLTPGARFRTNVKFSQLKKKSNESLDPSSQVTKPKPRVRINKDRITVRRRCGSGHRRKHRIVDFKRSANELYSLPHTNKKQVTDSKGGSLVLSHEYDPNRNARISLLRDEIQYKEFYILTPVGLKVGTRVFPTETPDLGIGKAVKLGKLPLGTIVHNIESRPYQGGKFVRAAGTFAKIIGATATQEYLCLRLPSKEARLFHRSCSATIGQVANLNAGKVQIGKAGRSRWLCRRPNVRGSAKNATDHPHGGGEGKTCIGRAKPLTPWGKGTLGDITRKRTNPTTKYILQNVRTYRIQKKIS